MALLHCESFRVGEGDMFIVNDFNWAKLKATVLKLKQRQPDKYESLLQRWPSIESSLQVNWEGEYKSNVFDSSILYGIV